MRHPRFLGLREDKPAAELTAELAALTLNSPPIGTICMHWSAFDKIERPRLGTHPCMASFARPPVDEVIFGILFKEITALRLPMLDRFWQPMRDRYPQCEQVVPALQGDQLMAMQSSALSGSATLSGPFLPRLWFVSANDEQLVQVQHDRLNFNWRRRPHTTSYPGFPALLPEFLGHLEAFKSFLQAQQLGDLHPIGYELTYVDVFEPGRDWQKPEEIGAVVTWAPRPPAPFDTGMALLGTGMRMRLQSCAGMLGANLRLGVRTIDSLQVYLLNVTARGGEAAPPDPDVETWMKAAHTDIEAFFLASTTARAHEQWDRRS